MTLEEAQQLILDLKEQLQQVEQERDTFKTEKEQATERIAELQEHNQKLFLRLTTIPEEEEEERPEEISLDELAEKLMEKGL